jgi:hypothetical protein
VSVLFVLCGGVYGAVLGWVYWEEVAITLSWYMRCGVNHEVPRGRGEGFNCPPHCYRPSGFMSLEQFIEFFEDSAILHVRRTYFGCGGCCSGAAWLLGWPC